MKPNNFLKKYDFRASMRLDEVNRANVIALGSSEELLTLIMSHCEHERSEDAERLTYDWPTINKMAEFTYIIGKKGIVHDSKDICYYEYPEDFGLFNQFSALKAQYEVSLHPYIYSET